METINLVDLTRWSEYNYLAEKIQETTRIAVEDDIPLVLMDSDRKKIAAAEVDRENLKNIMTSDSERITNYIVRKIEKYSGITSDQEYSPGQEPNEDEEDELVSLGNFPKNFLVGHLLEYYLLKKNREKLPAYLKATKMPQAKKYLSEISEIFSTLENSR